MYVMQMSYHFHFQRRFLTFGGNIVETESVSFGLVQTRPSERQFESNDDVTRSRG